MQKEKEAPQTFSPNQKFSKKQHLIRK